MSQNVHVVWLFVNNFKQVLEQPATSFPPPPNRSLRKTKQKINNTTQNNNKNTSQSNGHHLYPHHQQHQHLHIFIRTSTVKQALLLL